MTVDEFNERYGPEWKLWVDKAGTAALCNIVPLYMMTIPMGQWSLTKFYREGLPLCDDDDDFPNWGGKLDVPDEVLAVAERTRVMIVASCDGKNRRYFDVSTNDKLDAASKAALQWLWDQGCFPEPVMPQSLGYTLQDLPNIPELLREGARQKVERYIEDMQDYKCADRIHRSVKQILESCSTGWMMIKDRADIVFLE